MTGRERLLLVASLLWGKQWQTGMREELRINRRTLGRYVAGDREPSPHLLLELDAAMLLRIGKMGAALDATVAILEPDGSLLTFSGAGDVVGWPMTGELPQDLRHRLWLVLEEVKAHRDANQETPDAE